MICGQSQHVMGEGLGEERTMKSSSSTEILSLGQSANYKEKIHFVKVGGVYYVSVKCFKIYTKTTATKEDKIYDSTGRNTVRLHEN